MPTAQCSQFQEVLDQTQNQYTRLDRIDSNTENRLEGGYFPQTPLWGYRLLYDIGATKG